MKIVKILGALLGVLALVIGGFLAFVSIDGIPHYPTQPVELKVEVTPERVAQGKRWASMLCAECHRNGTTNRLSGADMHLDQPFGKIFSYNITQHPTKGIGAWTDGEIAFLLRTGIARDGRYTPPWMAKLPNMADDDLNSIIAFLRSDDPLVQPADVDSIPSQPTFFSKFLAHVAFKPFPYPTKPIVAPKPSDTVAYGRYLTWNLDCWTCHSSDFAKVQPLAPESTPGYLGGGNQDLKDAAGKQIVTTNITMDVETGIGSWTEAQFVRAVREGVNPQGKPVRMPAYSPLSEDDVKAIYAYLKTVPPLKNAVKRTPFAEAPASASAGEKIYAKYACAACHGETGVGTCDLTKNKTTYPTDEELIAFIREPSSKVPGSLMPTWRDVIPEAEMKDLVAHVRALDKTPAAPAAPAP